MGWVSEKQNSENGKSTMYSCIGADPHMIHRTIAACYTSLWDSMLTDLSHQWERYPAVYFYQR